MKSLLSPEDIRDAARVLRALEAKASKEAGELRTRHLEETGAERIPFSEEAAEQASLERELRVMAVEDELAAKAREALRRIENGTFGVCRDCEREIERERLRALPYALECSSCAR